MKYLPSSIVQWAGAAGVFAILAALGGAAVTASGIVDVGAVAPDSNLLASLLHFTFRHSAAHHAKDAPPPHEDLATKATLELGAAQYALVCENCHGAPGFGQSPIALSMRPEPPLLIDAAKNYPPAELFEIIQNGIRMTAMPAWPVLNRPDEVWAMVAFVRAIPGMDRQTYLRLAHGDANQTSEGARIAGAGSALLAQPATEPAAVVTGQNSLTAFIPSTRPRPYLPGDPQTDFPTPGATALPRTGFGMQVSTADPMAACVGCHGARGTGRPDSAFPNLTLQSPQYLYDALMAFASGQRQSGIMWPVAANLSEPDIRRLAQELGSGPGIASGPTAVTSAAAGAIDARGVEIASAGVSAPGQTAVAASAKVERCSSCHLPGAYQGRLVPRLDGQRAAYLRAQLHAFKDGGRGDTGSYDPMTADSHNLSDADIVAISAHYASLPPMNKN